MCGILGAFSGEFPFHTLPLSARNLDKMRHRGPDQQGWYVDDHAMLGFRRLAILDVEGGAQPLYSEDEQIVAVVNGEIYNHHELRKDLEARHKFRTRVDGEVLIHLYEEKGESFVSDLSGMFAFALYDRRKHKLVLGRDRVGKKPLYYRWTNGTIFFASEIKPLLQSGRPPIHRPAISDYLRFGYVPAPLTILEGIYKLSSGSLLVTEHGAVPRTVDYWKLRFSRNERKTLSAEETSDWRANLREELGRAVGTRLESEVPMGFLLSGGIDSASVFALGANTLKDEHVQAFTIGFKGESIDESRAAAQVANRYEADHSIIQMGRSDARSLGEILNFVEEPVSTDALLPTACVFQAVASANVTTVLAGEGSDELFAGYKKFSRTANDPSLANVRPLDRYLRYEEFVIPSRLDREILLGDVLFDERFNELEREVSELDGLSQMLTFETRMRLPDRINLRLDRLSMASSIEARAPFMDHYFMEFCAGIPHSIRTGAAFDKRLLREAMQGWLPAVVIEARKVPFHAPDTWLTEAKDIDALLGRNAIEEAGLVRAEPVQLLRLKARQGDRVAQEQVFSLYVLHAWYRSFYQRLAS